LDNIFPIIADAQITKGGPVIVIQPENEYTYSFDGFSHAPDPVYMQYVIDKAREHGIVMLMVGNDAFEAGRFVPGTGKGESDIYVEQNPNKKIYILANSARVTIYIHLDSNALV
jgi:hypothetical protein